MADRHQSNSKVAVDLSGTSNLVNSTGLSLNSTSISGTAVAVQLSATDFRTGTYLDQGSSQTYRVATASGSTVSINVQGDTDGLTGNDIVQPVEFRIERNRLDCLSVQRKRLSSDLRLGLLCRRR